MKKIITLVLSITMAIGIVGCGAKNNEKNVNNSKLTQENAAVTKDKGESSVDVMPAFTVKDLSGNEVTNEIFKDNKLTMINLWGTFCPPCIEEMPDLQKLYEEMNEKGMNLIGVVSDGDTNTEDAKRIVEETGVKYLNIIPDEALSKYFQAKTQYVPATIFVNDKGEVVGELIVGSRTKDEYKKIVEDLLNEAKVGVIHEEDFKNVFTCL